MNQKKLLIIEDDEGVARLARNHLLRLGYSVEISSTAKEALSWLHYNHAHLLILDYKLPDMTGDDFLTELEKKKISIPFVVITGNSDPKVALDFLKRGAFDYVIKDDNFWDLLPASVERAVKRVETQLKLFETEEALIESERRFKEFADHIGEAIFEVNFDNRITFVNQAGYDNYGYDSSILVDGLLMDEIVFPQKLFRELVAESLEYNSPKAGEFEILDKKGCRKPALLRINLLHKGGHSVGLRIIISDRTCEWNFRQLADSEAQMQDEIASISQRLAEENLQKIKMEKALDDSARLYRRLFEQVSDIVYCLATDGTILSLNQAFELVTGFRREEWIGRQIVDLLHSEDIDLAKSRLSASVSGKQHSPYELRIRSRSGGFRVGEFSASPLYDEGSVVSVLGVIRDVTERKKAEQVLIQSERLTAIETLAGGVAHEFNNFNVSISGFAELALLNQGLDDNIKSYLQHIQATANRAAQVTRRLKMFARPYPTKRRASANLSLIIRDLLQIMSGELERDGIQLFLRLAVVPDSVMDAKEIGQMALELLINARHSLLDRPYKIIKIETGFYDGTLFLRVEDSGRGISRELISRIFTPFFSTKGEHSIGFTPESQVKGVGLGLSMCNAVVSQHSGSMSVESEPDRGSVFTVYLPLRNMEQEMEQRRREYIARF
jgi:two-component system NtrC family sensor kinase